MNNDVCEGRDSSFIVACYGVHHGTADVAEDVVHPEGECRVKVNDFADEFPMGVGPVIDGFKDVRSNGGVWLQG